MKKKIRILFIFMILIITNISYGKFVTRINGEGKAKLKVPILMLENREIIVGEINKNHNLYQSDFNLKNYIENTEKVNEINFKYSIKILPSTLNFPVKYSLINLNNLTTTNLDIGQVLLIPNNK